MSYYFGIAHVGTSAQARSGPSIAQSANHSLVKDVAGFIRNSFMEISAKGVDKRISNPAVLELMDFVNMLITLSPDEKSLKSLIAPH